jgi:hypothetical protein
MKYSWRNAGSLLRFEGLHQVLSDVASLQRTDFRKTRRMDAGLLRLPAAVRQSGEVDASWLFKVHVESTGYHKNSD